MFMISNDSNAILLIAKLFTVLGAALLVLFGLFYVIGVGFGSLFRFPTFAVGSIVKGILLIVLGLVILSMYGIISFEVKLERSWLVVLIIGVVALIIGGGIGAVFIIIGSILELIAISLS